ncbi:outer membrane autotransporter protein [Trinickia symbiotica]|nr:outer membrane autotransporter protein [Trinickia symbiotica]
MAALVRRRATRPRAYRSRTQLRQTASARTFNDSTSDASGSIIRIDAGATGGLLDLSGRTSTLTAGLLESGGSGTNAGTVNLGANDLILDGASGGSTTYSGNIQGSGGLTLNGTGTQVLSGAHVFDYTGATNVNGGTLAVAGGAVGRDVRSTWKTFTIDASGTLDISANGGSFQLGGISGSGTVKTASSGSSSDLVLEGSGSQTFSGSITGSGGLTMVGSGTQTLSGSNVFDYAGDTTISSGTLAVGGASGSNVHNDRFTFDDGSHTGGTLDVSNGGFTLAGLIAQNPVTTTAAVRLGTSSGSTADLKLAGNGTYVFHGSISGYGNVIKQNAGNQTLSGTSAFGFTGTTFIEGGTLLIRNMGDASQFNHDFELNGGWLDLSDPTAFDSTGASANQWQQLHLKYGKDAKNGGIIGGDDGIWLGENGDDQTAEAQIGGDGTVVGRQGVYVVKTGTNTLWLTGVNHYVGSTRILGGTLKVSQDSNLGETDCAGHSACEREVVLNGGNLEVAGSFASHRQIQLQANGTQPTSGGVIVDDGVSTTWDSIVDQSPGANATLTKLGNGSLTFTGVSKLAGADVKQGTLDLGRATVDATTTTTAAPAITQEVGTTVSLSGGAVSSNGDGILANDTSTLNLANGTSVSVGAGSALYHVINGTGTLNASQEVLSGGLRADGAGTQLNVNLSNGSSYTGVPELQGGATAALTTDSTSTWNMTGDALLTQLTNQGTIVFGSQAASGVSARAAGVTNYQTLTVNGNYQGGGTVKMRTELNVGGALANQNTDRLLVTGNASGQTSLNLTTSGTGANTNTALNNQPIPTEGISLVQVGAQSTAIAFSLAGGYVVASGSPYQYRLFAYGPGSNATPDPSQSLLPNGQTPQWDYRLQTSYIDSSGLPHPGEPDGGGGGRPAIVPQGSTYLTAPLALQNYEATVIDNLYRRLGDVRHGISDSSGQTEEVFARTIDSRSFYHSNLGFQNYGYDFNQDIEALQFGGNWLKRVSGDHELRLGGAVTLGHTSVDPQAAAVESSSASIDTYNLALTGTWQNRNGWYVDGVVSAGRYSGAISTSQRGEIGRIAANGFDVSMESGRSITLNNGLEIEPHAQVLAQLLHFEGRQDNDGINVNTGDLFAFTGLLGVRMSMPVPWTVSWKPYMRVDFLHTWMNSPNLTMSGQTFEVATPGSAVQLGIGAAGMITPNLSAYGEVSGKQRLGHGFDSIGATLGLRYTF